MVGLPSRLGRRYGGRRYVALQHSGRGVLREDDVHGGTSQVLQEEVLYSGHYRDSL